MGKRIILAFVLVLSLAVVSHAEEKNTRQHQRPFLRWGLRTPHAANPYMNPYMDAKFWYPKYYGGFHYRQLHYYGDISRYDFYGGRAW